MSMLCGGISRETLPLGAVTDAMLAVRSERLTKPGHDDPDDSDYSVGTDSLLSR